MKRDMELVRDLLLKLEAFHARPLAIWTFAFDDADLKIEGRTTSEVWSTLELMIEADLIHVAGKGFASDGILRFQRLTWKGCEYLDDIRDPEVWMRTKDAASIVGGASFSLMNRIARAYGNQIVKKRLDLDL
ncbi:DUF2513 domain-containing protein [Methylobacterium sp. BTF04]|uniref:DUF2513 domain-containing protein n=1 Tax=Methylobacterium sp. BTF04 TaxID=2708300 RepID=UPI0013D4C315|nr:DUF2513 domain-containing protein [Methylobacterium sp. BTF04]NEU14852.1 DUF2513 domain-containing protein [Methylobacterium sp. BTF04]